MHLTGEDVVDHGRGAPYKCSPQVPDFCRIWTNYKLLSKESQRIKTFSGWSVPFMRPEDLAGAGFVYLQCANMVQCVYCYAIIDEWRSNDTAFDRHQKRSPLCPFLNGEQGGNVTIEDELRHAPTEPLQVPELATRFYESGEFRCTTSSLNLDSFELERQPLAESLHMSENIKDSNQKLNVTSHQSPKFPSYAFRESRVNSFINWPPNLSQNIESLVEAGLFYTGAGGKVKCFQCGGALQNLITSDIPWEEHAKRYPGCRYVELHKARAMTSTMEPAGTSAINLKDASNQDLVRIAREMDFEKVVEKLYKRLRVSGYPSRGLKTLTNAVLELEDVQSEQNEASPENGSVTSTEEVGATSTVQNVAKCESKSSSSPNDQTRTASSAVSKDRLCKVCLVKEMDIVLFPCHHFAICIDCVFRIDKCPLCRVKITGNIKIFW